MKRFVLVDRDGTVNVEKHYLSDPDDFHLIDGVGPALKRLQDAGFGIVVVTNQSGIARGYFDHARLDQIHARMKEILAAEGVTVDGVYLCPHGPDDDCDCRKPLPGMVEQAVADLGFDPAQAFMVGDKEVDVELGLGVGATTFLVRTGHGHKYVDGTKAHYVVDDLPQAAEIILDLAR